MEIDIELNLNLTPSFAQKVRDGLSEKFELVAFKVADRFSLRPTEIANSSLTIDVAIQSYLESIEKIVPLLEQAGGVLRVGAFFTEDEAAAFSVLLSNTTVRTLARYQVGIDVTCYPCS